MAFGPFVWTQGALRMTSQRVVLSMTTCCYTRHSEERSDEESPSSSKEVRFFAPSGAQNDGLPLRFGY